MTFLKMGGTKRGLSRKTPKNKKVTSTFSKRVTLELVSNNFSLDYKGSQNKSLPILPYGTNETDVTFIFC